MGTLDLTKFCSFSNRMISSAVFSLQGSETFCFNLVLDSDLWLGMRLEFV